MHSEKILQQVKSVMLGHAVADALGVPVEFESREKLLADPVTDMRGFGTYPYPAGCWSDDTSMSLAALDSLCGGGYDPDDIMEKFGAWYHHATIPRPANCSMSETLAVSPLRII